MTKTFALKKGVNRSLNIMFGDFCYVNRHTHYAQYAPLAIGLIAQYAKQKFGNDIKVSLFKKADNFLDQATKKTPDVVGLSVYFWNTALNQYVVKRLREMFGRDVIIILGGPSIDIDKHEQQKFLLATFPGANAVIANEGEIGFCNIIQKILGNHKTVFKEPIDGVSFLDRNQIIQGRPVGLTMDLSTVGSPYLSGLMDDFMHSDYQPLIQTSRFCPYTCTFCVSGKNRGKLRGYPIEQIKEELKYVSKKYADRPYHTMYLVDENFGILKRDVEIAEAIKKCKEDFGYPQSVSFYNDKRFTDTSRKVLEIVKDMTQYGVTLALQTENPESLKAINRRNVTEEEIDDAILWAKGIGLETSTELIFGLPYETKDNFIDVLDRSIKRGFDNVAIHNLLLMDGIEMNRPGFRQKYGFKTKYRPNATHYGSHNGTFFAEYEEIPISSNSFTYEDFMEVRMLNFMFFTVFNIKFQKWFFQFVRHLGISLSKFFSHFMKPDRSVDWPDGYLRFLDDFKNAVEDELFDTPEEVVAKAKEIFLANGNDVGEPTRINMNFGARLSYLESKWIKPVLLRHLDKIMDRGLFTEDQNIANSLIKLAERERVNLRKIGEKEPLELSFDVINWKKNKFKKSLHDLKMPAKSIRFLVDKTQASMINGFQKRFGDYNDKDFFNAAMDFIIPRKFLLYNLEYDDTKRT